MTHPTPQHPTPRRPPRPRPAQAGYSLVELLIVIAIATILLGIGGLTLSSSRARWNAETFVQGIAYDMNLARSRTMSTGTPHRVRITGPNSYVVEQRNTSAAWVTVKTLSGPGVTLALGTASARTYEFTTRGFLLAYNDSGATTSNTNITATFPNGRQRTLLVTALGLTRGV